MVKISYLHQLLNRDRNSVRFTCLRATGHVFDGKTHTGGQIIICPAKLHEIIAFVKEGSKAIKIFDILLKK
ncbi:hypothetical protein B2K_18885 [Paenibacillus mucilaginosus K02]|uniref:Uncharacterized protein n=1 Tax=Paenibacillus mucilaginosus K02 TaxID=997761 RepID=I0BK60_9BACL|nr:hypothetical protein B2K_18885 [Paenibacillus mucilaginosus K02]